MTPAWCSAVPGGVRLALQISANAKQTAVAGVQDGALKLRLQGQPIDGKANAALIAYLARQLDVARSAITITHGLSNKRKLIAIVGPTLTPDEVARRLLTAV